VVQPSEIVGHPRSQTTAGVIGRATGVKRTPPLLSGYAPSARRTSRCDKQYDAALASVCRYVLELNWQWGLPFQLHWNKAPSFWTADNSSHDRTRCSFGGLLWEL
jgi:hypothetical protein